jgi:hypothetical protein
VLGIKFSINLYEMPDINFESKVQEIQKLIQIWSKRMLSVPGRITVVKTIMLSRLTHLFISLPRLTTAKVKQLEKMLFNFVWRKKKKKSGKMSTSTRL